jgi:hypothetical protein
MWACKHCNQEFQFHRKTEKANHSRHCDLNPKKQESYQNIKKSLDSRFDSILGPMLAFKVCCKSCSKEFSVIEREKNHPEKDAYFCSRSCANSTGGKAKAVKHHQDAIAHYTTVAWRHHERKCVVCDERNIVAVHHMNGNHSDNRPENLVPLCPTHHQYVHSRYKHLVFSKIENYINNRWASSASGNTSPLHGEVRGSTPRRSTTK